MNVSGAYSILHTILYSSTIVTLNGSSFHKKFADAVPLALPEAKSLEHIGISVRMAVLCVLVVRFTE